MGNAMGNAMGCNPSCAGYKFVQARPPTEEQRERMQKVTKGYLARHEGLAVAPIVARAYNPTYKLDGYAGAAVPPPTMWRRTQNLLFACCPATAQACTDTEQASDRIDIKLATDAAPDAFAEDEVLLATRPVPSQRLQDPGPPRDALPAAFLGPDPPNLPPPQLPPAPRGDGGRDFQEDYAGPQAAGSQAAQGDMAVDGEVPYTAKKYAYGPRSMREVHPSEPSPHRSEADGGAEKGGAEQAKEALSQAAAIGQGFKAKYTLGNRLNAGAQGVTYLGKANFSGRPVVVKKPNDASDTSDFRLLSQKTHPNIVRVYECWQDPVDTYIVMEFCAGGDLFHAIEQLGTPTQNWTACVFRQLIWGVRYLHDFFNESHNDLKPENFFLDRKPTGPGDVPRAMIGDFGCLAVVGKARSGGDPRYRAPETFELPVFNKTTDMWSMGVTLYEIASGGHMIYTNEPNLSSWDKFRSSGKWDALRLSLVRGFPVNLDKIGTNEGHETEQLKSMLTGLLDTRPGRRFTAEQALQQPWLQLDAKSDSPAMFEKLASQSLSRRAQRHVLDMALLNLIGGMLQGESVRHYEKIWNKYDVDHDGRMQVDEFDRMIQDIKLGNGKFKRKGASVQITYEDDLTKPPAADRYGVEDGAGADGPGGAAMPSTQDLFTLADKNRSGAIEFDEFVALMFSPDQLAGEELAEYIKYAFVSLAKDDGMISAEELAGLFYDQPAAQRTEAAEVCGRLFQAMDTDEDGCISYAEFAKYVDNL